MSDLLIQGGTIIDGTGNPELRADLRVRDGRIVTIASDLAPGEEQVIDARGLTLTPGFIDGHTHHDPSLFWDSSCDPLPAHGVTTIVTGNCSLSLAPLRARDRSQLIDMFCFIEDLPVEAFERGIPWTWESFAEYRSAFDAQGAAVNQASFVGHSALRLYVMGDDAYTRRSDDLERERIVRVFESCLEAGAFGLSTSFADVDRHGRAVPSRAADDDEFRALLSKMAERGRGVLEFVPRMQNPSEQIADIERVHALGQATGIPATWTQLVVSEMSVPLVDQLLEQAARTQAEGPGVFPQVSPRPFDVNLSFESTPLFRSQPSWHALVQASHEAKRSMLADAAWRERARAEFEAPGPSLFPIDRPEQILLTGTKNPEQKAWLGDSLAKIAETRGIHLADALADLLLTNDLDPGITMVDLSNEDPEQVARLVTSSHTLCAASDAGAHSQMFCGAGDATLLLTRFVRERRDMALPEAIRRLTSELTDFFDIPDRGRIAEGAIADLALFDLETLHWPKAHFVSDLPGGGRRLSRPPGGYRATIVSGVVTHTMGADTGARPGRMLTPRAR
jgi:N-acyl-D-aspartate/D-glutamate deacylase